MAARFQIKIDPHPGEKRIVLADRDHPHFFGRYSSFRAAMLAADNRVRRERGMRDRLDVTRREIRAAMVAEYVEPPIDLDGGFGYGFAR